MIPAVGAVVFLAAARPVVPVHETWPVLLAAIGFLLLSASLSAAEVALFSLSTEQLDALERQERHGVFAAKALLRFRDETLISLLVADYISNLAFVGCLLITFAHLFPGAPWLWAPLGAAASLAAILVFGEYLPRALGRSYSMPVALATARPLIALTVLVGPLRWFVLTVSNALLAMPDESVLEREMGNEEELKTLLTGSDLTGGLEQDERELISGVVEFGTTRVGEIMTPRPEIYALPDETPHEEILGRMRQCEYRRVLIYHGTLDQVRGVLHVKDLLMNPEADYRSLLRKPLFVPETKGLMDLLREFRRQRIHLAVVCDEFGRTDGIVTMHDLLEEIVGELTDENHRAASQIRALGPAAWLVPGRTDLYELRAQQGLAIPEETGRTISGFVTNQLGRIPMVGDVVEVNDLRLTVERMGVRRVALLRIERLEPAAVEKAPDESG